MKISNLEWEELLIEQFWDTCPSFIRVKDEAGKLLYINRSYCEYLNWKLDYSPRHWLEWKPLQTLSEWEKKALNGRQKVVFEEKLNRLHGAVEWFETTAQPWTAPNGKVYLTCFSNNINEKVALKEERLQKKLEVQTIFEALPDFYFLLNEELRCTNCFSGLNALYFDSPDYFIGKNISQIFPPELYNQYLQAIQKARRYNELITFEYELPTKNGKQVYEARLAPILKSDIFVVLRNITRNKLTLETLKKREAQYRAVVEDQTELIFRFNTDATINFANEAFCRFFQTTPKAALNQHCKDVLGVQNAEEFQEHADKIRAQQIHFMSFEQKVKNKEEGEKWLQWTLRGLRAASDTSVDEFQAVGRDITQLKQTQSALLLAKDSAEKATRAKSEFLAIMSHEIRTPMNSVIGMTSLLANTNLSEEQKEYVEAIRSSGESLLLIINDILDFSKIESGKLDLEMHPFQLNDCMESILDIFTPRLYEKKLNFNYIIEPNVPATIIGDLTRLRQVLINFIGNAIKFTDVGDIIVRFRISREIAPEQVEIECSIKDTGIGISEDRLDLLFKPFSQVDSSTTRKYGGTGLGLAICAKLAELMHGKCRVQSAPNKGSTFYFSFIAGKKETSVKRYSSKIAFAISSDPLREALEAYLATRVEKFFPISADQLSDTLPNPKPALLLIDEVFLMKNMEKVQPFLAETALPTALIINSGLSPAFPGQASIKFTYTLNFPLKFSALENILREISSSKDAVYALPNLNAATETLVTTETNLDILVAEDNLINQKLIERILKKIGFRNIKVVENGKLAIEQTLCHPFDLILMDIQMPEMDGLTAARKITSYYKETKNMAPPFIIAMTANVMPSDKQDCLNAGMDDYISKPIRLEEVQMKILLYSRVIRKMKKLNYENLLSPTIPENTVLAKEPMGMNVYEAFAKELDRNLNKIIALANENPRPIELILRHIRHIRLLSHNLGAKLVAEVCQTFGSQLDTESEPIIYEEFAILVTRLLKQTVQAISGQNS